MSDIKYLQIPAVDPSAYRHLRTSREDAYKAFKDGIGGGWLEGVPLTRHHIMYVDEEGLLKRLPVNRLATWLAGRRIVGDAVVVGQNPDAPEEEASVDPVWVDLHLTDFFNRNNADWVDEHMTDYLKQEG